MNATVASKPLPKPFDAMLPWDDYPSEEKRKRAITLLMIVIAIVVSIVIPFVKVPPKPRQEAVAVPERIARVVERKVELPPPPPPKPKEEPKPEAPKAEEKTSPKEPPKPAEVAQARAKASSALKEAGLDSLASLRESFEVPMPAGGGNLITSTQEAGTSRAMLTSRAGSGSGGLAAAGYSGQVSSGFGGGKAGGKDSAGALGAGGGSLQSVKSGIDASATNVNARVGKDGKSHRTAEDIRKTFDRYGGRLNNLYQRALRDDPNMQGTIRLKLTIAPDGSVTSVSVASSQLNNSDLEAKILTVVKGFDFGAYNVEIWNGFHDLNFFPN